jgi:hypothetical protein
MNSSYLQVTYRHGRALAAYLFLPRREGDMSARTEVVPPGLVIDYTADGRAMGVEITAPTRTTVTALNKVLRSLGVTPVERRDIAPLRRQPTVL